MRIFTFFPAKLDSILHRSNQQTILAIPNRE
jgi:hypothetical protein